MKTKDLNTPEDFFSAIPSSVPDNLEYRMKLHNLLASDEGMQSTFLQLCWADLKILFNTCMFVYDVEDKAGFRNKPFILWPHQEDSVDAIHTSIKNQKDLVIDKSRKEGATEIICKAFAGHFILDPESQFLVGSRKAEYVDKGVEIIEGGKLIGLHKSLMHKICYAITTLPMWMRPAIVKTYMLLQNLDNSSVISGEATNENFGAGDRQTAVLIDEYGRIDYNMALSINDSIHDTSDCVIFNSTHFYGVEHPYNQLITQKFGRIQVSVMPWDRNPKKNKGLYISPDYDLVEISDIEYYRNICPEVFNSIKPMQRIVVSRLEKENLTAPWAHKLEDIKFIADGGHSNEGGWRSPWYDNECEERRPRDIACNLDRRPRGSGSSVFTTSTLHRIEKTTIYPPKFKGEIEVKVDEDGIVKSYNVYPGGAGRLTWWGVLNSGRPNQEHNYIVGCDISLGKGASNSVASILDTNTGEEIGKWICPNTSPEAFARLVVGLCKWIGGKDKEPYLIWEANGPGGPFENEVVKNHYPFVYIARDERARRAKKKNKRGWTSTKGTEGSKYQLCVNLDIALKEGLEEKPTQKYVIIHDINVIRELECYLFNNSGTPHPVATSDDDDSGAAASHGDRVIALGLCVLALKYQPKALIEKRAATAEHSLHARMKTRKLQSNKKNNRRFRY